MASCGDLPIGSPHVECDPDEGFRRMTTNIRTAEVLGDHVNWTAPTRPNPPAKSTVIPHRKRLVLGVERGRRQVAEVGGAGGDRDPTTGDAADRAANERGISGGIERGDPVGTVRSGG